MKPVYVILLMGFAAVAGGLLVRYTDQPVQIAQARSTPPRVVAPPIPPAPPISPAPPIPPAPLIVREPAKREPEKPSALSLPVHVGKPEPPIPTIVARTRVAPDPPAVTQLERSTVPPPAPPAPPAPAPPERNHVTLQSGAIVSVRIAEPLSSDRTLRGDTFTGALDRPLIAGGFVIAERGARVRGEVVTSSHAGRGDGLAELVLRLNEVVTSDGQHVHIVTQPWRKQGIFSGGENDAMVARHPAEIKPQTSIPFRIDQPVQLTEKH